MSWNKPTYKLPKKANRPFKKNAVQMGNLVYDTLQRHGIGAQVQAAMIVREGNTILNDLIDPDLRKDVRVISFSNRNLTIACRHSASGHLMTSLRSELKNIIEQKIPNAIILDVFVKIDPHAVDHSADTLV